MLTTVTPDYVSYADDQPAMLVTSYEPTAITRGTVIEKPEEGPLMAAGLVPRFTAIGRRPTRIVERVQLRPPRPAEIDALELKPGIAIGVVVRITYCGDLALETADIILAGNMYELEYTLTIEPLSDSGSE